MAVAIVRHVCASLWSREPKQCSKW